MQRCSERPFATPIWPRTADVDRACRSGDVPIARAGGGCCRSTQISGSYSRSCRMPRRERRRRRLGVRHSRAGERRGSPDREVAAVHARHGTVQAVAARDATVERDAVCDCRVGTEQVVESWLSACRWPRAFAFERRGRRSSPARRACRGRPALSVVASNARSATLVRVHSTRLGRLADLHEADVNDATRLRDSSRVADVESRLPVQEGHVASSPIAMKVDRDDRDELRCRRHAMTSRRLQGSCASSADDRDLLRRPDATMSR